MISASGSTETFVSPWEDWPRLHGEPWVLPIDTNLLGTDVQTFTPEGRPYVPMQWSGNPVDASVLLLMLNPGTTADIDRIYSNPDALSRIEACAQGDFDPEYPNPWLHPTLREMDNWQPGRVFKDLHNHLIGNVGMKTELAWRRLSQRVCLLELAPFPTKSWNVNAICSTLWTSVTLANTAIDDPDRLTLLARGRDQWRAAGLIRASLLHKSRGIRGNQPRINERNFPETWVRVLELVA